MPEQLFSLSHLPNCWMTLNLKKMEEKIIKKSRPHMCLVWKFIFKSTNTCFSYFVLIRCQRWMKRRKKIRINSRYFNSIWSHSSIAIYRICAENLLSNFLYPVFSIYRSCISGEIIYMKLFQCVLSNCFVQ